MLSKHLKNLVTGLFICLLLALATPAQALRCGTSIVQIGDSPARVAQMCGTPAAKTKIKKKVFNVDTQNGYSYKEITQWTYNFGPTDFLYIISFEKAKVSAIDTEGYGFH